MPRERAEKPKFRWRMWLSLLGWAAIFASTLYAGSRLRRFAIADPQFRLSRETFAVEGLRYASRAKVVRIFSSDLGRSIFLVPLAERRWRLRGVDWIEDASVARIWPNRLVVRIHERVPVAFVNLRVPGLGRRILLIDAHGVLLDPPEQSRFAFPVLSGVSDDQTEAERAERVEAMQHLLAGLGPNAKDISEVNASRPDDLRVIADVDGRALELILGETNFARRYRNFLNNYAEIRKRAPEVTSFDLRLEDRITAKEGT